jgi:chromosome segregation ATPase
MATPKLSTLLAELRLLSDSVQSHAAELPELQSGQEELAGLVKQASALAAKIVQLEGSLKTAQTRRDEILQKANHVREFLTAGLRKRYGVSSAKLVGFGVRPRVGRGPGRKKSQTTDVPEDSQPAN